MDFWKLCEDQMKEEQFHVLPRFKEALDLQPPHHPHRLIDDLFGHLGNAVSAVGEDNRDFVELESIPPRFEIHLDLKRIAVGVNRIEIDAFEYFPPEALESPGGIPYR